MNVKCVVVGRLETNCYILEKDGDVIIIDPGDEFDNIKSNIIGNVVGILLTHNHFDHIGALDKCKNYYNVSVYDYSNLEEGRVSIGKFDFLVKYNLGHTMDSISFIFGDNMFTGDFIFKGAIGRCDLGGDYSLMQESVRKILKSDKDYKIFPGHGDITSLNAEREMLEFYS